MRGVYVVGKEDSMEKIIIFIWKKFILMDDIDKYIGN